MRLWLQLHAKPIFMTVLGGGGGGLSFWELVNHVTSIAAMIGAIAGAIAATCSAIWWLKKFFGQGKETKEEPQI